MDDNQFISHFSKLYPVTKYEWKMLAAVVMLLVIGILISLYYSDWQYLERTGSLIVIVGVILVHRDAISSIKENAVVAKEILEQRIENLSGQQPQGLLSSFINQTEIEKTQQTLNKLPKLEKVITRRVRHLEALLFGFGTFIWGYGSLIPPNMKYVANFVLRLFQQ